MRALIVDTETHDAEDPKIVEYGQVPVFLNPLSGGMMTVSRHNPGVPITPGAMATHGILDEDVASFPPWVPTSETQCEYLIGHNIDFDWRAMGQPDVKRICTMALARKIWPACGNHKLMALVFMLDPHIGRSFFTGAHSVSTDVHACFYLLSQMIPILNPVDIEHLWAISEEARVPKIMAFSKFAGQPIENVDRGWRAWYMRQSDPDPYLLKAFDLYPPKS